MHDFLRQSKKILVKVSGEFLKGDKEFGICSAALQDLVAQVKCLLEKKVSLALVVGGGNFFRGKSLAHMNRVRADHMGMLSTVLNGIAIEDAFLEQNISCAVYSSIVVEGMCQKFSYEDTLECFKNHQIPIFVAGLGAPFFSTDTVAVLRALEMGCDLMVKATQVDGVYSADPKSDKSAQRFDTVSYEQAIRDNLEVMDMPALSLARCHNLPLLVCALQGKSSLVDALQGKKPYTLVH